MNAATLLMYGLTSAYDRNADVPPWVERRDAALDILRAGDDDFLFLTGVTAPAGDPPRNMLTFLWQGLPEYELLNFRHAVYDDASDGLALFFRPDRWRRDANRAFFLRPLGLDRIMIMERFHRLDAGGQRTGRALWIVGADLLVGADAGRNGRAAAALADALAARLRPGETPAVFMGGLAGWRDHFREWAEVIPAAGDPADGDCILLHGGLKAVRWEVDRRTTAPEGSRVSVHRPRRVSLSWP